MLSKARKILLNSAIVKPSSEVFEAIPCSFKIKFHPSCGVFYPKFLIVEAIYDRQVIYN